LACRSDIGQARAIDERLEQEQIDRVTIPIVRGAVLCAMW
jgi:hypothetical protein